MSYTALAELNISANALLRELSYIGAKVNKSGEWLSVCVRTLREGIGAKSRTTIYNARKRLEANGIIEIIKGEINIPARYMVAAQYRVNTYVVPATPDQPGAAASASGAAPANQPGQPDAAAAEASAEEKALEDMRAFEEMCDDDLFETFWDMFPKKRNLAQVRDIWKSLRMDWREKTQIVVGLQRICENRVISESKEHLNFPKDFLESKTWETAIKDDNDFLFNGDELYSVGSYSYYGQLRYRGFEQGPRG
ncbi:hypothetical protein FACS18948_7200 [Clostridia bacterium]|nr:hypothetical protein FACS18948_7200 [Clostridia bacterium]